MNEKLEQSIKLEGQELFKLLKHDQDSLFDKNYWMGRVMDWVMKDQSFKVDLFRFVDVLPSLKTKDQVASHIQEYLLKDGRDLPGILDTALKAASFSLTKGIAFAAIKKNVSDMATRFIMGTDIFDAEKKIAKLADDGFLFTIDLLGEKTLSDSEADIYFERYQELIENLPTILAKSKNFDAINDPPNVSIKISALAPHLKAESLDASVAKAKARVLPLLELAKVKNVFINFDLETYEEHEIVLALFKEILLSEQFIAWPHLGVVIQAYLKDSSKHLDELIAVAKMRQAPFAVRLVKGAYWDYEVVKAEQLGHDCPVFRFKAQTDQNYESLSRILLDNCTLIRPAIASHNLRSLAHVIAYAKEKHIDKNRFEMQMLYGMADSEKRALKSSGYTVRIYVPLGEMLPGMSYLVRRLLENTSQMGFLKLSHHDQKDEEALLKAPFLNGEAHAQEVHRGFINEPLVDFTIKSVRENFISEVSRIKNIFPIRVPVVINGEHRATTKSVKNFCPSEHTLVTTDCDYADEKLAEEAVQTSVRAFDQIKNSPLPTRVTHLQALAKHLREDKTYLSALMAYEVGKTFREADADVAEAIDFCEYYARLAEQELAPKKMGDIGGEDNHLVFQGRGPTLIISPWNFPLAILCGMATAAYVAGNPIILKPAEQSPAIAYALYERMIKAGFPQAAVQFVPGQGELVGVYLVKHKDIATIGFTGSMAVGHSISAAANTVVEGQRQMKRVVCEMGGKNAIVVDDDADLDEAVSGILASAFNFAGQKCSAASRIIAVGTAAEPLIARLTEATKSLTTGSSLDPSSDLGPVIDDEAHQRLTRLIEKISNDPSFDILFAGPKIAGGFYISPLIVNVSDPQSFMMQEEFFGPIIAVHCAPDLKDAINLANATRYGLTGAFYSRSPSSIAYAKKHFDVGNLYINQKSTGAIVGRQPFGGFKMSGTGIKAGGPHYLHNFVDQKLVSENTMRRGFTPEVSV